MDILFLAFVFIFLCSAIVIILRYFLPNVLAAYEKSQSKKARVASKKLDGMFVDIERTKLSALFTAIPVIFAIIGFVIFRHWAAAVVSAVIGMTFPNLFIRVWEMRRKLKFGSQLLSAIMILSSALKAGLSFLQSLEVLVEEAHPPLSQEFGWVVNEVKMGVPLEESLQRLGQRMPSEELGLFINSCVVARITGGDLTRLFGRLVQTIRNNIRLKEEIATLTLQGKIQGVVMLILPFVFIATVYSMNKHHFDIMLETDTGRAAILIGIVLQIAGVFLIIKFSKLNI